MRSVITHGHIFKNAGTTFDWSLQRNFGDGFLDHRDDKIMREHGTRHLGELLSEHKEIKALSSHHLCHRMPQLPGCSIFPVYFLRHPLERIASVYAFERRQLADTAGARAAKEKTLAEYVRWRMQPGVPRTIRNYQTIYLAGVHNYSADDEPGLGIFGTAMSVVRATPLIGIVCRYDESMVMIEHHLRDAFPKLDLSYVHQNVSPAGTLNHGENSIESVLKQLGPLQEQVIDNNSLDLAIYQLVNRRLDDSIRSIADFDERLAVFRGRCENRRQENEESAHKDRR